MVMPRMPMRKIREILRLRYDCGLVQSKIATSVNCGRSSVGECLSRFKASGMGWPLPDGIDDNELENTLFPPRNEREGRKTPPEWEYIHKEMQRKGVTLMLLWEEYLEANPGGYHYSQFCDQYRNWKQTLDLVYQSNHKAGEKTFIDYAGQTIPVYDPRQGGVRYAQIFLAVLGASNYIFAEATWTQTLPDWIGSHNRAFAFFGGVTELLVPDNLKAAVSMACRYDPIINPTYYAMAKHYGTAVFPARAKKPKDKAKAEQSVLHVERKILAALRNIKFFALDELNQEILRLLVKLNDAPFQKLDGSRRSRFEQIDKPALKPLPASVFEPCEYKLAKVNINYHIEIDGHYYSVPFQLVKKQIEARYTRDTVEILFENTRVASHKRSFIRGRYTTVLEHMPPAHKAHVEWTPERMINWVGKAGPSTSRVGRMILDSGEHPQHGFTRILGMIRLGNKYGQDRLENACFRALEIGSPTYRSLKQILVTGMDKLPLPKSTVDPKPIEHSNIRGPDFFR